MSTQICPENRKRGHLGTPAGGKLLGTWFPSGKAKVRRSEEKKRVRKRVKESSMEKKLLIKGKFIRGPGKRNQYKKKKLGKKDAKGGEKDSWDPDTFGGGKKKQKNTVKNGHFRKTGVERK